VEDQMAEESAGVPVYADELSTTYPDTVMEIPLEDIQEGDALLIIRSPISTFSIPPQSPAFEVRKIS